MTVPSPHIRPSAPGSPWPGSRYEARHRWQLDPVTSLVEAAITLVALAAELAAADRAGWRLLEPVTDGHLLAARPSRRQRGRGVGPLPSKPGSDRRVRAWRLRIVDEPPVAGSVVFSTNHAPRSPVLTWTGQRLEQTGGPQLPAETLLTVARQAALMGSPRRPFGIAWDRLGPNLDLIADGSSLRLHAVRDGVLFRTGDTLVFHHAADGATNLLSAAAAYNLLAQEIDELRAAGARLVGTDDGFLDLAYDTSGLS